LWPSSISSLLSGGLCSAGIPELNSAMERNTSKTRWQAHPWDLRLCTQSWASLRRPAGFYITRESWHEDNREVVKVVTNSMNFSAAKSASFVGNQSEPCALVLAIETPLTFMNREREAVIDIHRTWL
jgi:hypothetical protein